MRTVIAGLLALGLVAKAGAAEMNWVDPMGQVLVSPYPLDSVGEPMPTGGPVFLGGPHLRVTGEIVRGDNAKLKALLQEKLPDFNQHMFNEVVVSFASDGGDFYEALDISDTIQSFAVATYVASGDRCLSACAIAWLGGARVMLRGLPKWPARYLHTGAIVGFHAPFTELGKTLEPAPGADVDLSGIADDFYAMARFAISEIAARMAGWDVAADFVFDMLSMGPPSADATLPETVDDLAEQFVLIENYARLDQTAATLLADDVSNPAEIGGVDAQGACVFVHTYNRNLGNERGYGSSFQAPAQIAGPELETSGAPFPTIDAQSGAIAGVVYRRLLPADGPDSFATEGIEPGLGPIGCSVFRGDGWYVKTFNENIHYRDPQNGEVSPSSLYKSALDIDGAYPVNDFIRLGNWGSWLRPGHDIGAGHERLPAEVSDVEGPSFNCGGELDPAAELICRYSMLSRFDGAMGKLYAQARDQGLDVKSAQREWIKARNLTCRPERIDLDNPLASANAAHCLAFYTRMRVDQLAAMLGD